MDSQSRKCEKELYVYGEIKLNNELIHSNEIADFEAALEKTGIGKLSYMVLWASALGLLASGFQNGLTAYLLPSAKCDLDMKTSQMGLVNVVFMIGGITSACLWGILADIFGRRNILIVTFISDAIVTLAGSLSQTFYFFCISRFLNGFFIGGPGCLIFSYLGDLIPIRKRTKYICYVGFCFIMSWILLPAIALLIIPLNFEVTIELFDFTFNSWRLYLLIFTFPCILSAIFFCHLPESPRLLLANGYKQKSLDILKKIFIMNTGRPGREYSVKYLVQNQECAIIKESSELVGSDTMSQLFTEIIAQISILLKRPFAFTTCSVMFILFVNMFGCYGLGLWIPELLSRFWKHKSLHSEIPVSICKLNTDEIIYTSDMQNNSISFSNFLNDTVDLFEYIDYDSAFDQNINKPCNSRMDSQIFKDTMVIGLACLLYNFLSACISEYVSVKVITALSLGIAGVSTALIIWLSSPVYSLLAASIFQSAMMTGNIVIVGMVIDVFPSKISSMAVCIATLAGRVGAICSNLIFGLFMDVSCELPILSVAILSFGGAILVYFVNKHDSKRIIDEHTDTKQECSGDFEIMDYVVTHM